MRSSDNSSVNKSYTASASLKRLQQMSYVLDKAIAIPGSNIRVGLDPILGLLPGGGDVVTGLLSVYIVFEAAKMGLPAQTLGRMGGNILLDVLSGMVPVLGDVFDVSWKANSQNVALIEKHLAAPTPSRAADTVVAIIVIVGLVTLVIGIAALSAWVFGQVWTWLFR